MTRRWALMVLALPVVACACAREEGTPDRLRDVLEENMYGSVTIPLGRAPAVVPDAARLPATLPGTPEIRVAPGGLIAEPTPASREQIRAIINAAMRR